MDDNFKMELTAQYTFGREVKKCDNDNEEREPYKYIDKLNLDEKELDKLLFAVGFSFLERTFSRSVDPYFGTEICNALCKYNPELEQDKAYFKKKSKLYTYFSKLEEDDGLEEVGLFYKTPFTNYLRSLNRDSQAEEKKSPEPKKDPKSRDNFFKAFYNKFINYYTGHIMIIEFMKKAFEKALTNQEHLKKSVVESIKKMENKKLDLNESFDLIFTVLADILHCPIKFWRIEEPIEEDYKYQYIVSSYGTNSFFHSHLAFLRMNITAENRLLILYEEALNDEMEFKPRKEDLEELKSYKIKIMSKLGTDNYLDYSIDRYTGVSDKIKNITSLLEEIKTYSEVLGKKLNNKDIEELQKFIVDINKILLEHVPKAEPEPLPVPESKCVCPECEERDDLIKLKSEYRTNVRERV